MNFDGSIAEEAVYNNTLAEAVIRWLKNMVDAWLYVKPLLIYG